jgi:amino acid transporter
VNRPESLRVVATVALGVGAGLVTALVTNVLVGAFPDDFFQVGGWRRCSSSPSGLPIAALQVIFGIAGTVIGAILFLVIGNPPLAEARPPNFSRASGEPSVKF